MTNALVAIELAPENLPEICGFDFGDEPYQRELAAWPATDADYAMRQRKARVWAYATQAGEIVGYASLAPSEWSVPKKKSKKVPILVIPALALRREFWGKPEGSLRDERYSSQIMAHVLDQASCEDGPTNIVGLYVHPVNLAAIKLYERFGFQVFHTRYRDKETGTEYVGYIRTIRPATT